MKGCTALNFYTKAIPPHLSSEEGLLLCLEPAVVEIELRSAFFMFLSNCVQLPVFAEFLKRGTSGNHHHDCPDAESDGKYNNSDVEDVFHDDSLFGSRSCSLLGVYPYLFLAVKPIPGFV